MPFSLSDDGTLDTVVECTVCREELRFCSDALLDISGAEDGDDGARIEMAFSLAEEDHECEAS